MLPLNLRLSEMGLSVIRGICGNLRAKRGGKRNEMKDMLKEMMEKTYSNTTWRKKIQINP